MNIDSKETQFILMVQTGLINNMIYQGARCKAVRHTLIDLHDAFYAAKAIPEDMSAMNAAHEFLKFACENLQDEDYKHDVNAWYSRARKD
jgi:hypothetical protein